MDRSTSEVSTHDEAGSSGTTIEIKIKTMDSQTYSMRVDKQMPVPALKEQIASVTGVVTEHQRLICRGKVLKDDQLLSAYHVEDGHTLHLVVREPTSSSSESLPVDPGFDRSSSGTRGQFYQVAPGIVVETFNMPGQGDRVLPDVSRIISAVLGSIGVTNPGNSSDVTGVRDQGRRSAGTSVTGVTTDTPQTQPEQSGMRGQNDRSRLHNAFGIPAAVSFGSLQAPVIPDAITTLSQYLGHMSQEFIANGRPTENHNGVLAGNEGGTTSSAQSENAQQGLPSPASLAELLSSTRQMLNQQTDECLLQLITQLENQGNMIDPLARANVQSSALRSGVLLQNLGAFFLELGRAVTTLRLGSSPSEAVVNAGPAVFISPSGPNPLMVQALPFQPGASFGTPISGSAPSGAGLVNGLGSGFVPRRIDIQIRRGPSPLQTEPTGSQPLLGQRHSSTDVTGEAPNQSAPRPADAPSSYNGAGVRMLPFRTMMAAVPDLNRLPSDSPGGPLGLYYPVLGRYQNVASGDLSSRTGNHVSGDHSSSGIRTEPLSIPDPAVQQQNLDDPAENGRIPASSFGQREPGASRSIDINILSAGGIQHDQNPEGQVPFGILEFLRGLFPGGELHVESVSSQGTAMGSVTEQGRTTAAEEAEPRATEEGIFLSRLLQHIMPIITQDNDIEQNVARREEGDTSKHKDGATSSTSEADMEVGTSRRQEDPNPGPNPKRQKMK